MRKLVASALRDSKYLSDIPLALEASGAHTFAFRHMLAPPLSQDQFKLVCKEWSKTSEKKGSSLSKAIATKVSEAISERLDPSIANWARRRNSRSDVKALLRVTSSMMAMQQVATARRSRLSLEQESAVVDMLTTAGWTKIPSKLIDDRAAVPAKCFMHKTRFKSGPTGHQEVDIACGLPRSCVLAMECKVTNDETNSVKRINDVLKKASSWRAQWGQVVQTAALLQGVIAAKDVQRLTEAGVHVFWSHDLAEFSTWLADQT